MSLAYDLGFIVGILLVIIIITLSYRLSNGNWKYQKEIYDERQIQARGKVYKNTYLLTILLIFIVALSSKFINLNEYLYEILISIVLLSVGVFCINCIIKDPYAGINKEFKK